jgi:Rad3-related DNA helicase
MHQADILRHLRDNFPFPSIRPEQTAALESIAPWLEKVLNRQTQDPLFFGCDAPTGVGKAGIAVAVAKAYAHIVRDRPGDFGLKKSYDETTGRIILPQVWIATQNKILQDQYQKDFSGTLYDFKGLDNYECHHDVGKTCGQSRCGRIKAPQDLVFTPPEYCSRTCGYDVVKKQAVFEPILSLNVAKAFAMLKNPSYMPPALMILDEGHCVEAALDNEASLQIDPKGLDRLGFTFERYFHSTLDLQEVLEGLEALMQDVGMQEEIEESRPASSRDVVRLRRLKGMLDKHAELKAATQQGVEYVACSDEKVDLRPLRVYPVFNKVFRFPTLFLSATLLSETGFRAMTGIPKDRLQWFNVGSPFPKQNRPIRYGFRMGATPINYQNRQQQMPVLAERVSEILTRHANEKGIIHTHTYSNAEFLYRELGLKFGKRLLFPKTAAEQKDCLRLHQGSSNTVLLSPSMTEGVDLKDELCRFVILCKVPYLPTNDPIVEARMKADPEWYLYRSVMTIVQAAGRGVRSVEDHAVTYLCDPAFMQFMGRGREHFPKWFLEGYERGFYANA